MGFVIAPRGTALDVDALLQRADVAMYVAKAGAAGVARYNETLRLVHADGLTLVGDLVARSTTVSSYPSSPYHVGSGHMRWIKAR